MGLSEYMHLCMADPRHGYYQRQEPIGGKGDFITAPEVSQMFGELIGVWCIQAWKGMGKPQKFNLVELGPGKGTMMSDILRAAQASPEFVKAANVVLVESSPKLQATQRTQLGNQHLWIEDISKIPSGPSIFIANEFLDVLPFRQYIKHKTQWLERAVDADDSRELKSTIGASALDPRLLPEGHDAEPDGSVFEIAPAREAIMQMVAEKTAEQGGAALFIDYGHTASGFGDTFQAIMDHKFADPFAEPGKADLTNHVDFSPLVKVAKTANCQTFAILTQGEFLLNLGLLERAGVLGQKENEAARARLTAEAERLALPDQMGDLFKCFAFSRDAIELPPFAIDD
ncbi:MAG: SAM-dependent methyltransferase [Rhizobiaceae bacterium]|nr:SAM-dependent methyltransferase [Rhizobiaceae bacterium]